MSDATMGAREWTTVDKRAWGPGEWQDEPDKVQWIDEATGLDCLIVRNRGGALCGYVGIPDTHPLFEKEYNHCLVAECGESWCEHTPESQLRVHGGITFSDRCQEHTHEVWERWRTSVRAEAIEYPIGDAARTIRELARELDDYAAFCEHAEGAAICHVPEAGRPDRIWWFGFDCAHSGDLSPEDRLLMTAFGHGTYRTRAYVEGEVRDLARQLAARTSTEEAS